MRSPDRIVEGELDAYAEAFVAWFCEKISSRNSFDGITLKKGTPAGDAVFINGKIYGYLRKRGEQLDLTEMRNLIFNSASDEEISDETICEQVLKVKKIMFSLNTSK
ncbi:MAG TPA: hypothetical protein VG895_02560 [Patescibacteria group bacterium]|nr:hypothetical protein [Patescibacteria group bacterium]